MGWYEFVAFREWERTILDVGCGMGVGVGYMKLLIEGVVEGFDTDDRLPKMPWIRIGDSPLAEYGPDAFDVVTCIDVIEHVVDDIPFLDELKQIARKAVYVSTPNFTRSQCRNEHHAREYTIAEFAEAFHPDEIWVSWPDGWFARRRMPWPCAENFESPDGKDWPNFCAVFHVGGKA